MECENCNKRFAEGFKKGQESVLRKNKSGCCCIINDDDEVVSVCGAHKEWLDRHLSDISTRPDNSRPDLVCVDCGKVSERCNCPPWQSGG